MKTSYRLHVPFFAAILVGSLTWNATAASLKVGVVDSNRLMEAHPDAVRANAVLQKQAGELEAEQKTIVGRMETLRDEFLAAREGTQNPMLSDAARQREQKNAEQKLEALRTAETQARETLQQRQRELQEQRQHLLIDVAGKIRNEVAAVAKAKGLDLVVDASAKDARGYDVLLFHAERLDISDEVIQRYAPARR